MLTFVTVSDAGFVLSRSAACSMVVCTLDSLSVKDSSAVEQNCSVAEQGGFLFGFPDVPAVL